MNKILNWWKNRNSNTRKELRLVLWSEANKLIEKGWTIAPEEDNNKLMSKVYLELLPENAKKVRFVILRGRFSNKFFGVQLILGRFTLQLAYWKFGIFNDMSHKWWPDDYIKKMKGENA